MITDLAAPAHGLGALEANQSLLKLVLPKQHLSLSRQRLGRAHRALISTLQLKQRQDSEALYEQNDRPDLALREREEAAELQSFLPQAMSQDEIDALIEAAITETGASSIKDMGKVINLIKPQVAGRADNAAVAQAVKQRLG